MTGTDHQRARHEKSGRMQWAREDEARKTDRQECKADRDRDAVREAAPQELRAGGGEQHQRHEGAPDRQRAEPEEHAT